MCAFLDVDQQRAAWQAFIHSHILSPGINPLIAQSWERCWSRIIPHHNVRLTFLSSEHLLAAQVANFDLLSVTRPVMEDIYQYVENSNNVIVLVNGAGYILDLLGDRDLLTQLEEEFSIMAGAHFSEYQMGTNAFALSLIERVPTRVAGAEHYLQSFHGLAEAAAPIFDLTGRPLGALGLIAPVGSLHPHTMGLVVAGARAIEGQRQSDQLLAEQNSHLAELNAILASISDGILVWNSDMILMHINDSATKIIGISAQLLLGRQAGEVISYPTFIHEAMEKREPLTDVETSVRVGDHNIHCVLSLRFVTHRQGLRWVIVTFRQEKDVRTLIQHQLGAQAALTLDDIPGESVEIRRVRRLIQSAAAAQASVLICGESGTGKNVVASAIHNESYRHDEPFLIFACSSVPNELVVRELLGYEEGLSNKRPGGRPSKFELAQGGTLFFQDVDALPLEAQAILLNMLELGIVQRLGSDRPISVDVRIIAASSANMEKLIGQGSFRADLYYRLSTFEISLPPLRERQKDLDLLIEKILNRLSKQLGRPLSLAPDAVEMLKRYSWPGNVRELEAVISRAAIHAGVSEVIGPMHLPKNLHQSLSLPFPKLNGDPIQSLNEIEREVFIQTARLCKGNVTEMARLLQVGRTTVWRKLKGYNIVMEDFRLK